MRRLSLSRQGARLFAPESRWYERKRQGSSRTASRMRPSINTSPGHTTKSSTRSASTTEYRCRRSVNSGAGHTTVDLMPPSSSSVLRLVSIRGRRTDTRRVAGAPLLLQSACTGLERIRSRTNERSPLLSRPPRVLPSRTSTLVEIRIREVMICVDRLSLSMDGLRPFLHLWKSELSRLNHFRVHTLAKVRSIHLDIITKREAAAETDRIDRRDARHDARRARRRHLARQVRGDGGTARCWPPPGSPGCHPARLTSARRRRTRWRWRSTRRGAGRRSTRWSANGGARLRATCWTWWCWPTAGCRGRTPALRTAARPRGRRPWREGGQASASAGEEVRH